MNRHMLLTLAGACLMEMLQAAETPYWLDCRLEPADGFLKANETVKVTVKLLKDSKPALGETLRIITKWEGHVVDTQDIKCDGKEIVSTYTADKPGWVYFAYKILDDDGNPIVNPGTQVKQTIKKDLLFEVGAMFDADKIRALNNRPADFEAFWTSEQAKVKAFPLEANLTPQSVPNKSFEGKVDLLSVVVKCVGDNPVTGYLARPVDAKAKSLPIIIDFQSKSWTGGSKMIPCHAALNAKALAFFMTWHGMETGHPAEWYVEQKNLHYKQEPLAELKDPHDWMYHTMFYKVMRTLEFMKTLPEWNGKDLIVRGGSLGGIAAIAAAAWDKDVSLAMISVPGHCEFNAWQAGRTAPFYSSRQILDALKQNPDLGRILAYHDAIHFAPMITCETYVCTGFADELCCPSNVFAFYNALPLQENVRKFMSTSPYTGHYGSTKNDKADGRLAKGINSVVVSDLYEKK